MEEVKVVDHLDMKAKRFYHVASVCKGGATHDRWAIV